MTALLTLLLLFGLLVVVPLLIVKVVFSVLIGLITLPFRLLGLGARVLGALFVGVGKLAAAAIGVVAAVVGLFVALIVAPLLPLLLVAGFVWVIVQLLQPRPIRRF
jgi:hypothetical protein